jgi:hypothetical protein
MSATYYTFNKEVADIHGISAAILLQYIHYWCRKNAEEGRNFNDGKYWTYNTAQMIAEQISCLSVDQVRRAAKKLVSLGLIVEGNYNRTKADRMKWYALTDVALAILEPKEEAEEVSSKGVSNDEKCNKTNNRQMDSQNCKFNSQICQMDLQNCQMDLQNCQMYSNTILYNYNNNIKTSNKDIKISSPPTSSSEREAPATDGQPPAAKSRAEESKPTQGNCPFFEILKAYHSICTSYPSISIITGERKRNVLKAWKQYGDLSFFIRMFEAAEQSEYLKGNNDRGWCADFDWFFKGNNFGKVLEGRYAQVFKRKEDVPEVIVQERESNRSFDPSTIWERALAKSYGKKAAEG